MWYKSHSLQASEKITYIDSSYDKFKAMEKSGIAQKAPRGQSEKRSIFVLQKCCSHRKESLFLCYLAKCVSLPVEEFLFGNSRTLHPVCASFSREHWY